MPASMFNPRMRVETLNGTRGQAQSIPASILDPPVRTLLAQGTRKGKSNGDPQEEVSTLENLFRMFGPCKRWRRRLFIAAPPFPFIPDRGEDEAERTGGYEN